jgi:ABC-type lipoprotein export system ATPase subunit
MNSNIFTVKNLRCSYNGTDEVLIVDDLKIKRGKIIILLGISGAGKSTILETLGLMNNTLVNGSSVVFNMGGEELDIGSLWDNKDHKTLAEIRRKHFSFIFQNTNLMPNFTAYENISLTQMIDGKTKNEAIENAKKIAKELRLQINQKKKAHELSGGEKQRAAFIRAITSEFSVLFGDEPTGNLDEESSNALMGILRKKIDEKNATAIIVTHNIDLAIKYADQVIVLKKTVVNEDQSFGEITNEFIFTACGENCHKTWEDSKGADVTKGIRKQIKELIINKVN